MIALLRGRIAEIGEDAVVVDVGGVGYLVQCSARTLSLLPRRGETAELLVETQVREDAITLFGFTDPAERVWFRTLQSVQGVGARVALGVLSVMDAAGLARAIAAQDRGLLTRAPGVGPKLAARIVAELKDKAVGMPVNSVGSGAAPVAIAGVAGPGEDAISALVNLGYGRAEAFTAVQAVVAEKGEGVAVGEVIRDALKALAPR